VVEDTLMMREVAILSALRFGSLMRRGLKHGCDRFSRIQRIWRNYSEEICCVGTVGALALWRECIVATIQEVAMLFAALLYAPFR
jgi:hypothetical protein